MTVDELLTRCDLVRASEKKLSECKPFSCGEADLDEFFAKDCLVNQHRLLGKTYLFCLKDHPDTIVTAFSLSNDSIRLTNRITDEYKEQFLDDTDLRDKTLKRFPAVLIGRLGISTDFQSQHLGSDVLSFIKAWFVDPLNKTGCRFLLVDSYNKERNLAFYECNGFNYLFSTEEQEREFRGIKPERPLNSRLMYFDLIELIRK